MSRGEHKVKIIYKSGAEVVVRCDNFTVFKNAVGGVTRMEWDSISPTPLLLGVDEIAAVWELP